jgi:hypothetical protein
MQARGHRLRCRLETAEERGHEAVLLLEQSEKQVLRLDGRVLQLLRRLLRSGERFLGTLGKSIQSHGRLIPPPGGG